MAKINVRGSAYRVARGKGEMARDKKWQKTAKLTTKKDRELKKGEPAEKGIEESGGQDQNKTPGAEDPKNLAKGKATKLMGPEAPDNTKKP
ncbi:MAG: hypothetical protein IMZ46_09870 [Acidobacteria bacterium]|nr:hypothetical protein [Acidobacteriota bacterium]